MHAARSAERLAAAGAAAGAELLTGAERHAAPRRPRSASPVLRERTDLDHPPHIYTVLRLDSEPTGIHLPCRNLLLRHDLSFNVTEISAPLTKLPSV